MDPACKWLINPFLIEMIQNKLYLKFLVWYFYFDGDAGGWDAQTTVLFSRKDTTHH